MSCCLRIVTVLVAGFFELLVVVVLVILNSVV